MTEAWRRLELGRALAIAWLVLSLPVALACVLPFLLPYSVLDEALPTCRALVQTGEPCWACGLTRGFFAVARGEFARAQNLNGASIVLYASFVLNSIAAGITLLRCWTRRRERRRNR